MVLAEYRDDELSFVAPSADGAQTTSVTERLDTYAPAGVEEGPSGDPGQAGAPTRESARK